MSTLSVVRSRVADVFADGSYRTFYPFDTLKLNATWMVKYTSLWYVWLETRSALAIAMLAVAELLPTLFFCLIGGVMSDGRDRFHLVRIYQGLIAACTVLLGLVVWFELTFEAFLITYLMIGVFTAFLLPCSFTITTSIVEKHRLSTAVILNSINYNAAALTAPLVALVLVSTFGYSSVFFLAAAMMGAYVLNMYRVKRRPGLVEPKGRPGVRDTLTGLGAVVRENTSFRHVFLVLLVTSFFFRPILEQFPKLYDLSSGTADLEGVGLITVMVGAANLFAGVLLIVSTREMDLALLDRQTIVIVLFAAMLLMVDHVALFALAIFAFSVAAALVRTVVLYLLQMDTPEDYRGRVLSVYFSVLAGASGLGVLLAGALEDQQWILYAVGIVAGIALAAYSRSQTARER